MKRLLERYELHFLRNDAVVLVVFFSIFLYACYFFEVSLYSAIQDIKGLYTGILSISSGLFAFLITSITILISFLDNKKLAVLQNTPQPERMLKTFMHGVIVCAAETLVVLFTYIDFFPARIMFYLVVFIFLLMVFRVVRIIWILYNLAILLLLSKDS